jgi:transposase
MSRPRKYIISLTDEQVKQLKFLIRKKATSRTLRCRCQILLDLDHAHGKVLSHERCAKSNGICKATVSNIVNLYVTEGFDSVITLKRNVNSDQAKRKVDGRAEARLIELACSPAPEGHARWTLRLLEEKSKVILDVPVSKDAIGRAFKKTNLDLTKITTGVSRQKKMPNS